MPNPALVEAACRGEAAARESLVDAVLPDVLQWCARLGGPWVDAEDAAQDVCLVVLTKLDGLREPERFSAWLFGVTRRVLARHRRRAWVRRWVPGFVPDTADPIADPGRDAELSEISRAVQLVLESLPPAEREVLVLFDLDERSETEVAELLDIPLGTARSRVRAARERFRREARRHHLFTPVVEIAREGRS